MILGGEHLFTVTEREMGRDRCGLCYEAAGINLCTVTERDGLGQMWILL